MDECLHEILKTCNKLPGNKQYSSPKEAVNHVISTHIIEKDSCYDPEAEDVLTILSHVVSVLTPTVYTAIFMTFINTRLLSVSLWS